MSIFLIIMGMLSTGIFIVLFIISLFNKALKKKKMLVGIVCSFTVFIAGGCMLGEESDDSELAQLELQVATLQAENEDLKSQVVELSVQVEEAAPFFAMAEEEQLALATEAAQAKAEREAAEAKAEEERKAAELAERTITLGNGNYVAGEDFEAGIYTIVAIKGGGNVSSSNMFSGGINAVMGVADDGFYEKEYKNIKLPNGTQLTISGVTVNLIPKE